MATMTVAHPSAGWDGRRMIPAGVDPDMAAMVYLVRHDAQAALGVGVLGTRSNRLDELESLGWQMVQCWWFDLGFDAIEAEERLIDRWRNLFSLGLRPDFDELLGSGSTAVVDASPATERDAARFVDSQWRSLEPMSADRAVESITVGVDFPDPWLLAS